jgi:putative membrane protein
MNTTLIPVVSIVLLALPTYYFYIKFVGWKKGLLTIFFLSLYAFFIETVALKTGFPYGEFEYKESLSTQLTGGLPWPVLFAWPPLVLSAIAIAGRFWQRNLFIAFGSVLILVIYDLLFDPIAVALNFWKYTEGGFYFGVPLSNFAGWAFSGAISFLVYSLLKNPLKLPLRVGSTLLLYVIIWISTALFLFTQVY